METNKEKKIKTNRKEKIARKKLSGTFFGDKRIVPRTVKKEKAWKKKTTSKGSK